jgi:hypothetical protein
MADDRDALSRMQDGLYSRTKRADVRPRQGLSREQLEKPSSWTPAEGENTPLMSPPPARSRFPLATLFIGALVFFAVSAGIAAYTFLYGGNTVSSKNITLTVLGPSLVDGGKETTFQVTIENHNASELTLADLIIEYPEGTRSATDQKLPLPSERISLGTIAAGQSVKQTARAVLFGSEGSSQTIKATLEYHVAGSNAVFVKEGMTQLTIGSSPVAVVVTAPDEAVSGQPVIFEIAVRSNAQSPIKNVALEGQYPFGFSVTGASPESTFSDSLWQLGDLDPGEEKTIRITGVLDGQDNEERVFRFLAGSLSDKTDAHIAVPYLILPHSLTLKRPFIATDMSLNGDSGSTVVVSPNTAVSGRITWTNNLDTEVQDLEVTAKFGGTAFDRASVTASRGFYRSIDSAIVWSKEEDPTLGVIAPGAQGTLEFSFTPKSSGTNPQMQITVSVKAKRSSSEGNVPEEITSAFTKMVRVGSAVTLSASAQHSSGPIQNTGPMPPKVDQETTYTILLAVKNPSNSLSGAQVSASLPSYMRYMGSVTPGSEAVTFDERNHLITWNLGEIKAGVGTSLPARSVAFKVGLTPSISQAGQRPNLLGGVTLTADDRFTGNKTTASADGPTTQLLGDSGFVPGQDVVVK